MIACPECDKFPDHLKQICNGVLDGKPLDVGYVTRFRSQFGLPPIGQWNGEEATYPLPHSSEGRVISETKRVPGYIHPQAPIPYEQTIQATIGFKPTRWVGTNLAQLLKSFGVEVITGCGGCDQWMNDMNAWGPQGCRERFAEIRERLKIKSAELQAQAGRAKIFKIGLKMIIKAQWPSIDALIKKAIKQAERAR